jgi:transposase-like protein
MTEDVGAHPPFSPLTWRFHWPRRDGLYIPVFGVRLWQQRVRQNIFKEVKRRTRVVETFPNETSAKTLATEIMLRSSEEGWALKRYLTMAVLETTKEPNPHHSRR